MSSVDPTLTGTGARQPWSALPSQVTHWVERELGSRVVDAVDQSGGFSPGPAARVRGDDGQRAFVKAASREVNHDSYEMHRREARLTAALPRSPFTPDLLATYDEDPWVALLYTDVDGHTPQIPWRANELSQAVDALARLHDSFTPSPVTAVEPVADLLDDDLNGWRTLSSGSLPAGIDEWSARHIERLAGLEAGWVDATAGETLLHTDVRADNMLVTEHGIVFVDWAHASRGAAWFDLAAWAPSVAMQGGPDPDTFVTQALASRAAAPDSDQLTATVAAIAGYFTERAATPPPPGLPTLRKFQAAQGEITRAWLRRRTGWR